MANTGIKVPTITATQWAALQDIQRKAKTFLSAAGGAAAKTNLQAFQHAFNYGFQAVIIAVQAAGGDPKAPQRMLGTTKIKEDGLWGPEAAIAMAITLWMSFPPNVWSQAATELATANVINAGAVAAVKKGLHPLARNLIVKNWYPKWKVQVSNMVWKDYSVAVTSATKPPATQNNANTTVVDAQSNQSNANNQLDKAQGGNPAQTSTQKAIPVDDTALITAPAPESKSLTWLWALLGVSAVGGGLWWAFGRKAH